MNFHAVANILEGVDEIHLYLKIAETVRRQILTGSLRPGDRLPSVRKMAQEWQCTVGTIQRAYQELSKQGLVVSRSGWGTRVADNSALAAEIPLRKAALVHRAETYLLEMLNSGFNLQEIESAVSQAMDRWRTESKAPAVQKKNTIQFSGSHDLAVTWLASHFGEIAPGYRLELEFSGSLGGLIALAEGKCDLAGCHLWDAESQEFNLPFIRRILPDRQIVLVTLAQRRIGLIVPPGNPAGLQSLPDLVGPEVIFINRQPRSGTRVWLDHALMELDIPAENIPGYASAVSTHSAVARAVAEGKANVGIGLEAAATSYGLDFIFLRHDRYDLVIPQENTRNEPIKSLLEWLSTDTARTVISGLGGYDVVDTGKLA